MKLNKSTGLALCLILLGVILLLPVIGWSIAVVLKALFPVLLMVVGYIGIKNGRSVIGWGALVIGLVMLLGKLSGLAVWIIAIALIVYGISLLTKKKNVYE